MPRAGKDVVVVGSGAAGLAAAIGAAATGANVLVLEKAVVIGGTTAFSAGTSWLPGNRHTPEEPDGARSAASRYLEQLALGDASLPLIHRFVADAARVVELLEALTPLRWRAVSYPDYHSELDGGSTFGRSLEPVPVALPAWADELVRLAPRVRTLVDGGYASDIAGADGIALRRQEEAQAGHLVGGRGLVGALAVGARSLGAEIRSGVAVDELVVEDGAVQGVRLGAEVVAGQVVLATGGFERDMGLRHAFLGGPSTVPLGAKECSGDGLRLAIAAGALLGNMSDAWWCPTFSVPGEQHEGVELCRLLIPERARPSSIVVDRAGRRFADEAQNYSDFGRSLHSFEAASFRYPRVPCWLVFDHGYRGRYNVGPITPTMPDPDWLRTASSLDDLGEQLGTPTGAITETVKRFNALAVTGRDDDFGRGAFAYDRFLGDQLAPHPNLAPLLKPPFYAVEVRPGCLGTKGGARTDEHGRVLGRAECIRGLYAAGNAAASPFGLGYPGAGGTIGPALVFGLSAGEAAARDR